GQPYLGLTVGLPLCGVAGNVQSEETVGFWWWMGPGSSSGVDLPESLPSFTGVSAIGPNPFTAITTVHFQIAPAGVPARVRLEIFDVVGRSVTTLVDEALPAGSYSRFWDRRDRSGHTVPSGVYFARFVSGDIGKTIRLVAR
ncbi:MAG: hypothetical protein KC729_00660, partial [Candidatus Eisenbacteria bacterium]|nr:hypothetical protein [Candidatus Eisenbacteria bacterium]